MSEQWLYRPNVDNSARFVLGTVGDNPLVCFGVNPSTTSHFKGAVRRTGHSYPDYSAHWSDNMSDQCEKRGNAYGRRCAAAAETSTPSHRSGH